MVNAPQPILNEINADAAARDPVPKCDCRHSTVHTSRVSGESLLGLYLCCLLLTTLAAALAAIIATAPYWLPTLIR